MRPKQKVHRHEHAVGGVGGGDGQHCGGRRPAQVIQKQLPCEQHRDRVHDGKRSEIDRKNTPADHPGHDLLQHRARVRLLRRAADDSETVREEKDNERARERREQRAERHE
eukprot:Amastigsp_a678078_37.p5 type:complete len:111 gc:universal Amastigsp_a678078_37:454-786(+)